MSDFVIRSASGAEDREFIRTLDRRLADVIVSPAHSQTEVAAFQARFTATAFDESESAGGTFVACRSQRRLGYVNVRPVRTILRTRIAPISRYWRLWRIRNAPAWRGRW